MRFAVPLLLFLGIAGAAIAAQSNVEYGVAAGESLQLDAHVPDGAGPFPAVILVHGGGWMSGDKSGGPNRSFIYPLHAPLERAGFAWFSINYRLAPKHPYPACIEDVETAIRWVTANAVPLHVDPRRIAWCGESSGGHLVLLAAVRASAAPRPAGVVAFYAPVDFTATPIADGEELPPIVAALFGRARLDGSARALLREASPLLQVKPGLPPVLLLHGTADEGIPFARSTAMQARLRQAGMPCELFAVEGGGHGMETWDEAKTGYQAKVVAWLGTTLKSER